MAVPTNLAEALALLTYSGGNQITGQDVREVVTWLSSGASATEGALETPLVVAGNVFVNASGVGDELVLSVAASGHIPGSTLTLFVAAYSRSNIVYAPSLYARTESGAPPTFDVSKDTIIVIRRVGSRFETLVRKVTPLDQTKPILAAAHVTTANQSVLRLDFDEGSVVVNPALLTLNFSVGTPKTVTTVRSGNGTSTVLLNLSGALADSDVCDLTIASGGVTNLDGLTMDTLTIRVGWYMVPTEWTGLTVWRDELLAPMDVVSSGQWPSAGSDTILIQQATVNQRPQPELFDNVTQLNMGVLLPFALSASNDGGDLLISAGTHGISDNQPLVFYNDPGATLPGGITKGYVVWTKNTTGTTFKLSLTNGGANIPFSSAGSGTFKARKVASVVQSSATFASIVSTAEDTFWTVSTPLDIMPYNGAPSNNPGIWGHGFRGLSLFDFGTDDWRIESWGSQGFTFRIAQTQIQLRTPCLIRSTRNGANIVIQRDRASEIVGDAITALDAYTSAFEISRGQPNGYVLPQVLALFIAGNSAPTAKEKAGIEGYLSTHPACRFLRPNLALPPTLWVTVGRTARLSWESVLLNAMPSQFTFEVTGPGTPTSTGWTWAPSAGDIGTQTLTVKVKLGTGVVAQASMSLVVTASTGTGTRTVLCIGDSITGSPGCYPPLLYDRLVVDGFTTTMVGTRGGRVFTAAAGTDRLTDVSYGTGYAEGTKVRVRADTSGGTNTLPTGLAPDTDYYWRDVLGATGKLYVAPSGGSPIDLTADSVGTCWVISDRERNEGRPGWQWLEFFSTGQSPEPSPFVTQGVLDMAGYLAALPATPTHVPIMLGTNDLVLSATFYESETLLDSYIDESILLPAERIVQALRTELPTAKIGILYTPPMNARQSAWTATSLPSRWAFKKAQYRLCRRLEERFGGRTAEGIDLVPTQVIDTTDDFDPGNNLHPNTQGQTRLADAVAAWVKASP